MEQVSYNDIMKDTQMRRNAANVVIARIQEVSKRTFPEDAISRLSDVLSGQEVEEGVSVFMASSKPSEKTTIGKVDVGKEYITLWWGKNIRFKENSYGNRYALGINFSDKELGNAAPFTFEELLPKYPEFKEVLELLTVGTVFNIFNYAKASDFYKAVKDLPGEWILQTPSKNGSFIPTKPIGKIVGTDDFYIFQPKNTIRTKRYAKTIEIVG